MNIKTTAKALAIAALVGASSHVFAQSATTNDWWSFDFDTPDTGTSIDSLTNLTGLVNGVETKLWSMVADEDLSVIAIDGPSDNYLNLNTQGQSLTFTPETKDVSDGVLIDANVYLVGAEDAPTGFHDNDTKKVQTAVYLKNYVNETTGEITNKVLCALINDDTDAQGKSADWVELGGYTFAQEDAWVNIRIELNYVGDAPMVSFIVSDVNGDNATVLHDAANTETTSFKVAYSGLIGVSDKKVSSVSFRGTGGIDNFVGAQYNFTTFTGTITTAVYTNGVEDVSDDNTSLIVPTGSVTLGDEIIGQVEKTQDSMPLAFVKVYTNGTVFATYDFSDADSIAGIFTEDENDEYIYAFAIPTPAVAEDLAILVEARYGTEGGSTHPEPEDANKPKFGTGEGSDDPVLTFDENGNFVVRIEDTDERFDYFACAVTTLDATTWPVVVVKEGNNGVLELKVPTGSENTLFVKVGVAKKGTVSVPSGN